jgi:hypothetical protein
VFIEELEEEKVVEQHFMESQTTQRNPREENIVEVE